MEGGGRENVGVRASPERAASWLALVQSDRDWGPPLLIPLRYALRYPLLHRLPPMGFKDMRMATTPTFLYSNESPESGQSFGYSYACIVRPFDRRQLSRRYGLFEGP